MPVDFQTRVSQLSAAIGADIKSLMSQLQQLQSEVDSLSGNPIVWSDTAGETPDPQALGFGQLFINVDDGLLFFKKSDGTLVQVSGAPVPAP